MLDADWSPMSVDCFTAFASLASTVIVCKITQKYIYGFKLQTDLQKTCKNKVLRGEKIWRKDMAVRRGHIDGSAIWRMLLKLRMRRFRCCFGHVRWPYGHVDQWIRWPAWSFLLVFYTNHNPMHRFWAWARSMGQTERQTDGSQNCLVHRTITTMLIIIRLTTFFCKFL